MNQRKPDEYGQILDDYEQEIEDHLIGNFLPATQAAEQLALLKRAALNSLQKDQKINLRINAGDLTKLKNIAKHKGLKYQTFITSALHEIINQYPKEAYE